MTDTDATTAVIEQLHATRGTGVLAVNGGSGALAQLLAVPGASRTVLEARLPYSDAALRDWLNATPEAACAPATARAMAMAAWRRARTLAPSGDTFGLGCTASLATDRPKQGEHRVHVATQTAEATVTRSLTFTKDARSRPEEEAVCAALILDALGEAKGTHASGSPQPLTPSWLRPEEHVSHLRDNALGHWRALLLGHTHAIAQAAPIHPSSRMRRRLVFPGAFNPLHAGHREMAALAHARHPVPVEYELCVVNIDKPPLDYTDLAARTRQFPAEQRVWLTAAPRFEQKAALFPGAVFIVGADTLVRIAASHYYGGRAGRDAAIRTIAHADCSFLVFGRKTGTRFLNPDQLDLPSSLRTLCKGVDEATFRKDLSSTALRKGQ